MLEGCVIEDGALIGMGALDGETREYPQRAADEYQQLRARYLTAASTTA
jgi:hypothetical protein